jgi:methanogenic corrinoid protein MtbC1
MTMTGYPIRAAARMTGLSVDTLRAWERRYQAVSPARGQRGRLYTERQIERLKRLATLVTEGHAIGTIAPLPDAALRKLGRAAHGTANRSVPPVSQAALEPVLAAITAYDLPAIDVALNRHALVMPPAELIFSVILPALNQIGSRWQAGTFRPAQEHLMSGIVRGVLGGLLRAMARPASPSRMVFATPAGERHELGLLCGAVLAASAGHQVIYLGPDLPAPEIADAVRASRSDVLVLAATIDVRRSAPDLQQLAQLPEPVSVWAGGARAIMLRDAIGKRARIVEDLEAMRRLLERRSRNV